MTKWHRENGYIRNFAIIAAYEMADYLFEKHYGNPEIDAWWFIELGAELNQFQFMKIGWTLETF